MKPIARDDLVLRELDGEAVVYDFSRHQAHCLNATALAVWRASDGKTGIGAIGKALGIDEETVWIALAELDKAHLLSTPLPKRRPDFSRRRALKRLAVAAAVPAVWSIVAPTPAYAASMCRPASDCMLPTTMGGECCGSSGQPARTCLEAGMSGMFVCNGGPGGCPATCP